MDTIKDLIAVVLGGRLSIEGKGRTFVKAPLWLAVLAGFLSPHLALVTALLVIAAGMRTTIEKA